MTETCDNNLFYRWEVPGKTVSVRLSLNAVDRLRSAVAQGFSSIPRRGLETGGLLLGRTRRQRGGILVQIEDFEPVDSEHVVGPSYLLSPADRKILEERIAWRKAGAGRLPVVGFYRSHTRKDFGLAVEDVDLFSAYFGRPSDVFLLVKSNDSGPATAGFVIWEAGKIRSPKPYLEFPFERAALLSGDYSIGEPPSSSSPAPLPARSRRMAPARSWRVFSPSVLLRHVPRIRFASIWAGIAVLLAAGLIAAIRQGRTKPPASRDRLSLSATREGGALRLGWDRQSGAIKTARRAVLWIEDGAARRKLDLDPARLSSGSIAYWPKSGDVTFRLEVESPSSFASESLRAVGAAQPAPVAVQEAEPAAATAVDPPATAPQPLAASTAPELLAASTAPEPLAASIAPQPFVASTAPAASPARTHRRGWAERQLIATRPIRQFTSPPLSLAAPPAPFEWTLAPPDLAPAPMDPDPSEIVSAVDRIAKTRPPAIANPFLSIAVEPVSHSRGGLLSGAGALLGWRKGPDFTPPSPSRTLQPDIPAALRARTTRLVPVDVKLYVNPSGKVDYAELLSSGTGRNRELASLAVFSARRWEFVPPR
ncbi:MAG: hypothetical protein LAQ30_25655 [Acidobacteriia bacterium]|nr:hypothetical protein [Terriglobia bacterium]